MEIKEYLLREILDELRNIKVLLSGATVKAQQGQTEIVDQLLVLSASFPPEVREAVLKLTNQMKAGQR
jgi:hypothetical protein